MECRDVREMADSFLARKLLTETNHEILRHLDACPVCRADVAGRRASREEVRRAFQNARELGPTPEFTMRLRATLEQAARSYRARRSARFQGWWALAATALLAVALGLANEVVRFYADGVGLARLGSFEDHDGFDGVMVGAPGAPYHLEFTRKRGHVAGGHGPNHDDLLVFFLPDRQEWQEAVDGMVAAGYRPVGGQLK